MNKCFLCHKELELRPEHNDVYRVESCAHHPTQVYHSYCQNDLIHVTMRLGQYFLEIRNQRHAIIIYPINSTHHFYDANVPENLTYQGCLDLIDRVLKIKAFL